MQLPFLYEKSGAIALVLMAGRLPGWLADEIVLHVEIFLNYILDEIFDLLLHLTKVRCYYSHTNVF